MSSEVLFAILALFLAVAMLAGQWTAFALGSSGMLMLFITRGTLGLTSLSSVVWNSVNSYVLIAVPLFLLMGEIILRSGAGEFFYRGVAALMGRTRGALLHANTLSCAIFSAVSGSSVATAATVGTVAIPEMLKQGYQPRIVFGSLAAGGTLGILIPPSIVMVLYGALVQESVSKLFIAGIVPGLLLAFIFLVYGVLRVRLDPSLVPAGREGKLSGERLREAVHVLPVVAILVAVLGGIYTGFVTPTEAAALGAVGALLLAAGYRRLTRQVVIDSLMSTVRATCMLSMIIVGAQIMSTGLTYSGASRDISTWVVGLGLSKWAFFGFLVALYIFLGCFVDGLSMIYMTLPVLFPTVVAMGFDPIWFGVVLTVLIELGQITPPVGLNLFTIHAISGGHRFGEVALGSLPYAALVLLMLLILAIWPGLATWLPATI
jgi:tripartite ATP-independent transporter DctM subunit